MGGVRYPEVGGVGELLSSTECWSGQCLYLHRLEGVVSRVASIVDDDCGVEATDSNTPDKVV